ncbi:hypothetical protein SDJN03_27776, partial [Cucurbita argyrosperma subsp. sororia]
MHAESNCHQKTNTEKHGEDGATNQIGRRNSACAITVSQAVAHGGGARGGGASRGGGARGGGGVSSPHTGGSAVIPIYVAGSAQAQRRRGRPVNAGNRHENNMWLLVAAALAAIAHL